MCVCRNVSVRHTSCSVLQCVAECCSVHMCHTARAWLSVWMLLWLMLLWLMLLWLGVRDTSHSCMCTGVIHVCLYACREKIFHMCGNTHASLIRVTTLMPVCDMTDFDWPLLHISQTYDLYMCIYICDIFLSYTWHDSCLQVSRFVYVTRLIHIYIRDTTHSHTLHDSFICDSSPSCTWHDSFKCVTPLIHIRDKPHSYTWNYSFMHVTRLIDIRDTTHSCKCHDSFIFLYGTRLVRIRIYIYVYIYIHTWHGSYICMKRLMWHHSMKRVTWLTCLIAK